MRKVHFVVEVGFRRIGIFETQVDYVKETHSLLTYCTLFFLEIC